MNYGPLFSSIQRFTRFDTNVKNMTNNVDTCVNFVHTRKGPSPVEPTSLTYATAAAKVAMPNYGGIAASALPAG
jgi:hypothetical protein